MVLAGAAAELTCTLGALVSMADPHACAPIDANGNLTSDGTRTFEWDINDRLQLAKAGTTTLAAYATDGLGRRAASTIGAAVSHVVAGQNLSEERQSGIGVIRHFYRGATDELVARQNSDGSIAFLVRDHLGSVVAETDEDGQLLLRRSYDPFGNPDSSSASVSGFAFSGRQWEATIAQYDFRARQYDAVTGRFTSEDPITFRGGTNFYAYVESSPINKIDLLGHRAWGFAWRTCVGEIQQQTRLNHCGNGKNSNDDPSCRVAHCVANCEITRRCVAGRAQAAAASSLKEIWDEVKQWTYDQTSEGYSDGDQRANQCGREFGRRFRERTCVTLCKDVR